MCNPPRGSMASLKSQNYGINIAKSIEGGSMKLTTLVHYMYIIMHIIMHICVMNVVYFIIIIIFFFNLFFLDLLKAKPLRYCTELLV